jgi:hypothetical protein
MFELKHHSPSSVSKFIENKFVWWTQKTGQTKFKPSIPMIVGTAVEEGINHWIRCTEPDVKECVRIAHEKAKSEAVGIHAMLMPDDRDMISKCVNAGISSVSQLWGTEVSQCQLQTEIRCPIDGLVFPAYGKLDWNFPSCVVDNKVVGKKQSELSQAYKMQGAVYKHAEKKPVFFHFITKTKIPGIQVIEVTDEDYNYGMDLFTKAAKAIEKIVDAGVYLDFDLVKALFFPDPSASWNKDEARDVM